MKRHYWFLMIVIAGMHAPAFGEDTVPGDVPHDAPVVKSRFRFGLSAGVDLGFDYYFSPNMTEAIPELFIRLPGFESTFRYSFNPAYFFDLSVDGRFAPRIGAYVPAIGLGLRLKYNAFQTSGPAGFPVPVEYFLPSFFASVVPLRFDISSLLSKPGETVGAQLYVSALEIRYGPFHPEVFRPVGMNWPLLFQLELSLVRLSLAF